MQAGRQVCRYAGREVCRMQTCRRVGMQAEV